MLFLVVYILHLVTWRCSMSLLGFHGAKSHLSMEKEWSGHTCGAFLSDMVTHFAQTGATWPLGDVFLWEQWLKSIFCLCRMAEIKWWERDYKYLQEAALRDRNVHGTMAHCGLMKFIRIPLMKSLSFLLQMLVHFWDVEEEVFLF